MAFLQEPRSRPEPPLRAPLSVLALIAVLVAAHTARVLAPQAVSDDILNRFALVPAYYSSAWLSAHHFPQPSWFALAVPFISHMFLHASFAHVGINCLWLLAFGTVVARRFGGWLFYAFFLICGIAGGITHVATNWGSVDAAIGASGAIAGVMAAGLRMLRIQGSPAGGGEALMPLFAPTVLFFSFIWVVSNVIVGFTGLSMGPVSGPVAWQAHLGGYFVGLFLAGPFDRLSRRRAAKSGSSALKDPSN